VIDRHYVRRLQELEQERLQLMAQAAGYRLQAFHAIEGFVPKAAKVDTAMVVFRYAREHLLLTGVLLAAVTFVLRKRVGMLDVARVALQLGSRMM
jgi:hypothetical protein